METAERFGLSRESYIIIAICMLDLVFTAWLIQTHRATEGNPLMAYYLNIGIGAMVGVKIVLVVMPIFIAEWARRYRPDFVKRALRLAIVAYLGLYMIAFLNAGFLPHSLSFIPMSVTDEMASCL